MKIATLTALFVAAAVAAAAAVIPIPSIPNNDDTVIIRATTSNGAEVVQAFQENQYAEIHGEYITNIEIIPSPNSQALPNFACYSRWLFSAGNDIISGIPFTAGQSQPSADLASRSLAHSVGLLCNRLGPSSHPTRDAVQSLLIISFNTDNSSNLIVAPFNEIANLKIRGTDIIRLELIAGYGVNAAKISCQPLWFFDTGVSDTGTRFIPNFAGSGSLVNVRVLEDGNSTGTSRPKVVKAELLCEFF